MEVHAHTHTPRKKWSHYFWEFLMLFLAVFCGFLAENLREHYIEHQRAHVYAASMVEDLALDTIALNQAIKYWTFAAHNVDTLMQLLSAAAPDQIPSGKLYWYGLWGGAMNAFVPNDATFQQMKSSGSLRYFTNKSINKRVAQYDQLCRKIQVRENYDVIIHTDIRMLRAQIFAFQYNEAANRISRANMISPEPSRIDSFKMSNPPLLTTNRTVFNQYLEMVRSRRMSDKKVEFENLRRQAVSLLGDLKKEYHLE